METQQRVVYTIQHVCIHALLCKTQRNDQNETNLLDFHSKRPAALSLPYGCFSAPTEKKQVSKPVSSIKQQPPLASEAYGCQYEAVGQYLWLNRGCCAARQAASSWLYSFRVPLQSADLLLCGSTRTDFDSNHCPLIVLTCLIVVSALLTSPQKMLSHLHHVNDKQEVVQQSHDRLRANAFQNACFFYWM